MSFDGQTAHPRQRRHRGRVALAVMIVFLVLVGVGGVLADNAARAYAQTAIEQQLSRVGTTSVRIGGFSFLAQYLLGRLDRVEVDAPALSISGATVRATLVATGVPVDRSKPVEKLTGSFVLDQTAVNTLIKKVPHSSTLTLGQGTVSSQGELKVLGAPVKYTLDLEPRIDGGYLVFTPTKATVSTGSGSIDGTTLLGNLQKYAIPVCVAHYLPANVSMTQVKVTRSELRIDVAGASIALSVAALSTTGTCPPR
jgi:hypothetical protein